VLFALHTATLLLFPAAATWAWRRGRSRGLWATTAIGGAVCLGLALIAASEVGGNRLANTDSYGIRATRLVSVTTLVWVLPVVASAASVQAVAPRIRSGLVFPIAVGAYLAAAVAGTVVAIYSMS
jgi:hypothetical protein